MSKGTDTRETIVERAIQLASRSGLEGLTIGSLSSEVGMSKSGLFAHFGSKERLQLAVVDAAARRFVRQVIQPAFQAPRGLPRVEALVEGWLAWGRSDDLPGGCLFVQLMAELDDQPGPTRDMVVSLQREWMDILTECVRRARDEGHLAADVDPAQIAFALQSYMLGFHHADRLLEDPHAEGRLHAAVDALLASIRA